MANYEVYRARSGKAVAEVVAAGEVSPFTIEVCFLGGLTDQQMQAFRGAADRWTRVISGDLPSVSVDGEIIDDLLILAQGDDIDGPGAILGQAGPTHLRPQAAGASAQLPAKGIMTFDTSDLAQMEAQGTLNDVIAHEMGHVIGVGTVWSRKGLVDGIGGANPRFTGAAAMAEFGALKGDGVVEPVPVENSGGQGTRDSHWRDTVFMNELMTGFVGQAGNPLSRLTVTSLQDIGYEVDMNAAEPYQLPNLLMAAAQGALVARAAHTHEHVILPLLPIPLPEESLVR